MVFRRQILPREASSNDHIANLVAIGINLGSSPVEQSVNIEDVLYQSSLDAIIHEDFRILSLITTWLGVHFSIVNVDRLTTLVSTSRIPKFRAYWTSIAMWLSSDGRFSKMIKLYNGPRLDLIMVGTDFQISRVGEDERFSHGFLRVPANLLRNRLSDVLTPKQLAQRLRTYYTRTLIGPSYRADMWAELETNPDISTAELARRAYGSFATAWRVKKDWHVLHP